MNYFGGNMSYQASSYLLLDYSISKIYLFSIKTLWEIIEETLTICEFRG